MKITTILLAVVLLSGVKNVTSQEQMMPVQTQDKSPNVSDKELEKFANIYVEVQAESQKMQKEAVEIIQEEGMEIERFNEISNSKNDPNQEIETTEKEEQVLTTINSKIQKMNTQFQGKVAEKIQNEGLTIQRYQEVYAAIQKDQELQEKLGELING